MIFSRYPAPTATALCVVGAVMFLPEVAYVADVPVLPNLGKQVITLLSLFIVIAIKHPQRLMLKSRGPGFKTLFALLVVSALGTTLVNPQKLYFGPTTLPALTYYDALTTITRDLIEVAIPFFI